MTDLLFQHGLLHPGGTWIEQAECGAASGWGSPDCVHIAVASAVLLEDGETERGLVVPGGTFQVSVPVYLLSGHPLCSFSGMSLQ